MVKTVPVLEAAGLVLRPLRESDKAIRLGIPRDPEYVRLNGGEPSEAGPLGKEGVERWFESLADSLRWVIALDDRPIGEIRFHKFAPDCRSARLAIGIWEPSNWNKALERKRLNWRLSTVLNAWSYVPWSSMYLKSTRAPCTCTRSADSGRWKRSPIAYSLMDAGWRT